MSFTLLVWCEWEFCLVLWPVCPLPLLDHIFVVKIPGICQWSSGWLSCVCLSAEKAIVFFFSHSSSKQRTHPPLCNMLFLCLVSFCWCFWYISTICYVIYLYFSVQFFIKSQMLNADMNFTWFFKGQCQGNVIPKISVIFRLLSKLK